MAANVADEEAGRQPEFAPILALGADGQKEAVVGVESLDGVEQGVGHVDVAEAVGGDAFGRVKQKNRDNLAAAGGNGQLEVILNSVVKEIGDGSVVLDRQGEVLERPNDAVIVCAGGILPMPMLKEIGIRVETKYGTE
ncbi:MAG: hypothetical protein ACM31P_12925 [Actinomycetota bacterium]